MEAAGFLSNNIMDKDDLYETLPQPDWAVLLRGCIFLILLIFEQEAASRQSSFSEKKN